MKVDVKVSEILDRLVLQPRVNSEATKIKAALTEANPTISFNRSADGFWVHSREVSNLNLAANELDVNITDTADRFINNRQRVFTQMPPFVREVKRIKEGGKAVATEYLSDQRGLEVLDDHQWVNVACMTLKESPGICIFDEQGAGKTVTLIFAFDVLVERNEVDFALIIAPKSMISEWPMDIEKFMPGKYHVQVVSGPRTEKQLQLSRKADILVTNFETASSMEHELRAILRKHGSRAVIVIDESFYAKNLDASRTQSIRRLREYCGRSYVLCGTPAPNSPVDLVQQFNIVDFGLTFNEVVLPKDREQAAEIVRKVVEANAPYVRHLKADVLPDLPAKKFNRIILPFQPQQAELYSNALENLVSDLSAASDKDFERNRVSFLARRSALLQICSNPTSLYNDYNEIPSKLLALDQILHDLINLQEEKVIIWSFYTKSIDALVSRYSKYNAVRYDGTISDTTTRREMVRSFREDKETKLFIGNPAAAGAGLNLQSARYAVYESMSNQAAHYLQSLDRIHRRGQKAEVEYLILLSEDSIEISEYERLIRKEEMAQVMLGDKIERPITRETMLSELVRKLR